METDNDKDSQYTASEDEDEGSRPASRQPSQMGGTSPSKTAISLTGGIRTGQAIPARRHRTKKGKSATTKDQHDVASDSEDEQPLHKRLLSVEELKLSAQYYKQVQKQELEQIQNVEAKVRKRREFKDTNVSVADSGVIVPGADSMSESEHERHGRIMRRKARRKKSQIVSFEEKMRMRKLQSNRSLSDMVCAFVEISADTRERMLRQLLGHREIMPGEKNKCTTMCCYLSYRFFSLLEVISSLEVSAKLSEERYFEVFPPNTDLGERSIILLVFQPHFFKMKIILL